MGAASRGRRRLRLGLAAVSALAVAATGWSPTATAVGRSGGSGASPAVVPMVRTVVSYSGPSLAIPDGTAPGAKASVAVGEPSDVVPMISASTAPPSDVQN